MDATTKSPQPLSDIAIERARAKTFAVLSTLLPDGQPQNHVMWVDTDGANLLMNTEVHRRKYRNVAADPRVTILLPDNENPYIFSEVRGRVAEEIRGPRAHEHIEELAMKYMGTAYPAPIQSERVILVISPDRVYDHQRP